MSRESVAEELGRLLAAEGLSITATPQMFGTLMRRACPDDGVSVDALEKVLTAGIVSAMHEGKGGRDEVPVLADQLVHSAAMSEPDAQWAIETWWRAIRRVSEVPAKDWSAWNRLEVPESAGGMSATRRSIVHLIFVGVAAAMGGALWGVYVLSRADEGLIKPVADALEDFEGWARPMVLFALGGVGGFGGGILGWMGGGARGGASFGRLGFAATGAFIAAAAGGLVGLVLFALPGMMPGAMLGGAIGAFLGLLVADNMSGRIG